MLDRNSHLITDSTKAFMSDASSFHLLQEKFEHLFHGEYFMSIV